jgi:DnaK suppressor protein
MLTEKKKKYFQKVLNKQLDDLMAQIQKPVSRLSETKDDSPPDFTDQATMESDMGFAIHLKERESKLILKIRNALEKIEDGTFGICEECGRKISEKRLEARPVTTLCIRCKKEQEAKEKLMGQ